MRNLQCLSVLLCAFIADAIGGIRITTPLGDVIGQEEKFLDVDLNIFLGVPFAKPPVGDLRFRPPLPIEAWDEPVQALQLPNACYQMRDDYFNNSFRGAEMWNPNTKVSEDCLYLNIWAPADARNAAVLVWIFGGGLYSGSPSLDVYDGRALASQMGVIVVNLSYRLSALGFLFLNDDGAPGNMGLLDQQMAMQFVRDNIASFGGNPKQITLMGESAGGASVSAHLIAEGSRNLITGAIIQSSVIDNPWSMTTPEDALKNAQALVNEIGCASDTTEEVLECLRSKSAEELTNLTTSERVGYNFFHFPFVAISRDRNFFSSKDAMVAMQEGDVPEDVNLLIGQNRDEGYYWLFYDLRDDFFVSTQPNFPPNFFDDYVENRAFRGQASLDKETKASLKRAYGRASGAQRSSSSPITNKLNFLMGDFFFACDLQRFIDTVTRKRRMNNSSSKVYANYFDQVSSVNPWPAWSGVLHGYEIEFIFGAPIAQDDPKNRNYSGPQTYTKDEQIFSREVMRLWTSFAKTGTPQSPTTTWPEYAPQPDGRWLRLNAHTIELMRPLRQDECAIVNNFRRNSLASYRPTLPNAGLNYHLFFFISFVLGFAIVNL